MLLHSPILYKEELWRKYIVRYAAISYFKAILPRPSRNQSFHDNYKEYLEVNMKHTSLIFIFAFRSI